MFLDAFRFDSLDYLLDMSARIPVRTRGMTRPRRRSAEGARGLYLRAEPTP